MEKYLLVLVSVTLAAVIYWLIATDTRPVDSAAKGNPRFAEASVGSESSMPVAH